MVLQLRSGLVTLLLKTLRQTVLNTFVYSHCQIKGGSGEDECGNRHQGKHAYSFGCRAAPSTFWKRNKAVDWPVQSTI